MFRLQRQNRSSKSGEKIDFKFSNFQAIQVPKGWDKLFVSVISVETGKTIAKSSKAPVRSGNCQWAETLSESVWISQDESIKALEECLFKFVVAMGSARSGILGEATVNMASYMTSKASVPVFLPLKKCNYGTILQVKIHCLTPRTKLRDDESKDSSSPLEEQNVDHYDTESKSNGSADSFSRNVGAPSTKDLGSSSHPGELLSREASFSASGSHQSFDSAEDFKGREDFPTRNELNGDEYNSVGRQDAISSLYSSPRSNNPAENPSQSSHSSFNSRVTHSVNPSQDSVHSSPRVVAPSSYMVNSGSSKDLLQAAEDTIEELRAEAKMWERNARKLMVDLDILKNEFSDQSKKQADLDMELSLASTERDNLKKEVGQLKLILDESMLKQTANEVSTFQSEGAICIQKELENEIRFQQESNASLSLQLNRSQESNIELVTVLQELEETIEKQKVEIENLSSLQLKFSDMENSIQEKLEENRNLSLQLQQLQESEKKLQVNLQVLEQLLEDKSNETLLEVETEYRCKLSSKEKEIASLEAKLSESLVTGQSKELGCDGGSKADLIREIEALKEKLQELESDCSELTDENLELLLKLKDYENNCIPNKSVSLSESKVGELKSEVKDLQEERLSPLESCKVLPDLIEQLGLAFNHVRKPWYNIPCDVNNDFESDLVSLVKCKDTDTETWADSILHSIIGLNNLLESRIVQCEEVLKHGELEIKERNHDVAEAQKKLEDYTLKENKLSLSIQELESLNKDLEAYLTGLEEELNEKSSVIEKLEADLFLKEEEMGLLRQCRAELEAQVSDLRKEKVQLAENMENVLRESNVTSKCLDDLRTDLKGNVSANEILEMRFSEMESQKHELELQVLNLEKENKQLSKHISDVEAQLKYMTDERELHLLEIENSKSVALGLQDEVRRFRIETEREKLDLKQKLHHMQNQNSEAQEDCENLKLANRELQVLAESLTEECNTLQEENDLLRKQKLELHEHCTHLETELGGSQTKSCEDSERVEALEANLSAMVEAFALKEKSLTSKIDALLQENTSQKEKLVLVESLLHQTCLEKTAEVENLQREIEWLTEQISAAHNEKERIASEVVHEVASLHASKAKLESVLQELQSKLKLTEIELLESRKAHELLVSEREKKLKSLRSCRKSEEKLKTDLNDVELKLTVSEYERQQLIEETANLKVQLLKVTPLQDEILALKSELNETKLEKEKVEASLKLVFGDCEELKTERTSFLQKISISERAILEIEECKSKKVELEEKLLQMESDLSARETVNNQFCSKILLLEEEKSECLKKLQALEEHLKSIEEQKKVRSHSRSKMGDNKSDFHDESPRASGADHISKIQMLENELSQALESNNKYKIQLQRFLSKGRSNNGAAQRKPTAEGEVVAKERFERTKSSLETELRDLRERYLEMSLKYAEVEGQREDLVMQLKATKNGKKWFSGINDRST